jgi:hypothetical protein
MAKYLYVFHGGSTPKTDADKAKVMDAWGKWMGGMGSAIVDGGHPVGKSSTVNSDGSVSDNGGSNPTSGYTLIEAATLVHLYPRSGRALFQHGVERLHTAQPGTGKPGCTSGSVPVQHH